MKKIVSFLLIGLALVSCFEQEQLPLPPSHSGRTATVSVSLSQLGMAEGTKSVCSVSVEDFVEAYVFAFPKTEGPLISARHVPGGASFSWSLPMGMDLEIWAIANPDGDDLKALLDGMLSNASLTRQQLRDLPPYTCPDAAALAQLDANGRGMPMSGKTEARFDAVRGALTIPLRRLFAKYSLKLNCSRFIAEGWTISACSVKCRNSNSRVPYFYGGAGAGYAAGMADLVSCLDQDAGRDLDLLNHLGGNGVSVAPATFYFPENCQGDIVMESGETARSWKTVCQDLGSRIAACSYLAINVTARKEGVPDRSFTYRVYPGNGAGMNSNFDIVRNTFKSLTVTLVPGMESDSFRWTPAQELTVEPGGSVDIPFETTLDSPSFSTVGNGLRWEETRSGVARYQADANASEGTVYALGGDADFTVSDRVAVRISSRYRLRGTILPGHCYFESFRLSVTPNADVWPSDVDPYGMTVRSLAASGREAIEILSGPSRDADGWYFTARCTGPRSAEDLSETLEIRDGHGDILGVVEIPDVTEVFEIPSLFFDGPAMLPDGRFVLPYDGADCARIDYACENEAGAAVPLPSRHLALASADGSVDDLYVEYGSGSLNVYLPCWEGIPGLQDFDQSTIDDAPYLQSVANAFRLLSKTGYIFHEEPITFLIPNPFVGFDAVVPHPKVVSGRKVDLPSGWSLQDGTTMEWHIEKDRSRPSVSVTGALLSGEGYMDAGTTYAAAPQDAFGHTLPYDIVRIPLDGRTYGRIGFVMEVGNVRSGETATARAAVVDVVRELEISASFRIHQRHYPLLSPYNDETLVKVSVNFNRMSALTPFVGMDFLKMTATPSTPVHPTKAEAESLGPFWVNYAARTGTHKFFTASYYILTAGEDLSYEIHWDPGPTSGYFNYRVITLWNPPQFDFDLEGFRRKHPDAFPSMRLVPASGDTCRYLQMDDYTRIVFYWERWKSAYTDTGKGWYLCDNETLSPRYASAYYEPLSTTDPLYGRCFFGAPGQTGTDVDPVYGGDPFFIQSNSNTFETILDY